jgi:2-keto-4-pentenoate hydratase/2-oxohepta-3-ene-1,7-dioic acid hydratase in catechol pathway
MRLINVDGRLAIERNGKALDVEHASDGRFSARVQAVYDRWSEFRDWAAHVEGDGESVDATRLGAPAPDPRQVFAIGLNYRDHAAEGGVEVPEMPMVFTKFPSSITGPYTDVRLPAETVDWEAELVVVIGRYAQSVRSDDAWDYVAGLTVGQDLSERTLQRKPQLCLAKSFPGFSPLGPALVTPDEFDDPSDLEIGCLLDGEQMQKARTSDLIFGVPELVAYLSSIVPLWPGDVIFTGTPSGVGAVRKPPRFLRDGNELTTYIEGIGTMRHQLLASSRPAHTEAKETNG